MLRRFMSTKYKFYDLVVATPTRPQQPIEASLMKAKDLRKLRAATKVTFEGKYTLDESPQERIEKIFGGRIRGDTRTSSSRLTRGQPRNIAGVMVPDKPPEPDNCCMSGCINCVWEMYRDDVKEWNEKRFEAAAKINEQGGDFIWPHDFHPPVQHLGESHIPEEFKEQKKDGSAEGRDDDTWSNVPVAIRVFAEAEKKIKARKKQREAGDEGR
ncbi:hypothetical protein PSN45_000515 [Yamadazyma tenuis]|uniref:Oxidoreductase-like domain-containing protein n=1 Tax=Candida tenuis (strain ATCC 10573 / BCRC 21748 / CBS 615 / JCM 9827 / NBRC 10315 / NRRL Y-1498 / VKM Y-70) TaxID=590646 RepID=G3B974_CANTC|nr:uncharacterized protein CANTEDRAFT_115274 [Yamadazyma tenuis ATCC 10573]EGV61831.1 hypothetical protein CANTEDRAFT_115274 [Yamadazyma tenuis ATCC 10573]WEJ93055.1 hypothetical protein PSN45_000515 [Yamadazyma tenuis]